MTTATIGQTVVEVTGEGFPVVMIHGLGGTSNMFQPQLPALSGYRVVRIDLPGSGRSPRPLDPLTMETMCQAVIRAMDGVGAGRAHFVGHSMGTIVCQQIAVQQPQMVASLTLFGALAEPAEATRQGLAARARLAEANSAADPVLRAGLRHYGQGNDVSIVVGGSIPLGGRRAQRGNVEQAQAERRVAEAEIAVLRVQATRGQATRTGVPYSVRAPRTPGPRPGIAPPRRAPRVAAHRRD